LSCVQRFQRARRLALAGAIFNALFNSA
jgi:hypothetical protein